MPIYGYRCQSCQHEFETTQRMIDPPQAACPDCGGAGVRLFFPAGILFKGSGFYKTDSRSAPASAGAGGDSKSDAKGATEPKGGDAAKAGSKPAGEKTTPTKEKPASKPTPKPAGPASTAAPAAD